MKKFTLPAGTTNRHKWHKGAAKAIEQVTRTFNMMRQIYGQHGGESRESVVSVFGFGVDAPKNPEAVAVYTEIGERFGWEITRDNADAIEAAMREALPACMATIPVEDNRTTPEQDAEREAERRQILAEQQAKADAKAERVEAIAAELRRKYPDALPDDGSRSDHARAAANLKRLLQAAGLRAKVRSSSFSMGDDVTAKVLTPDLTPEQREEWREIAERFSYSTFDPMTDCQGYKSDDYGDAWRQHFGRTKYCSIEFEQSDANKAAIIEFLGEEYADEYAYYRIWTGADCRAAEFWQHWAETHPAKPEKTAPDRDYDVIASSYSIEKHHHTKRGFDFFIVVLAERVDRDTFVELRRSCKAAGGWYSRKWGSTPGGFAFEDQAAAESWAAETLGGPDSDPQGPTPPPNAKQATQRAAKFREMAGKLAGDVTEIEAGAFKESGTGVESRLVVLDKPESVPDRPDIFAAMASA